MSLHEDDLGVGESTQRRRLQEHSVGQPVSSMVIENVGSQHSGNYTCAPENSAPSTVTVYVLRGK